MNFFQVLGNSDKYNPPNAITLDHRLKQRSRTNPGSGSVTGPEIHVHLEGLGDALRFNGSVLPNPENMNTPASTIETLQSNSGTKVLYSNCLSILCCSTFC